MESEGDMQGQVLTLVRVEPGAACPDQEALRAALNADQARLRLPVEPGGTISVTGPYAVRIDGHDFDEYVVWQQ